MPGMLDPMFDVGPVYTGLRPIDVYMPAVLALAIGTVALVTFPPNFGVYREKGVLKRLAVTPMPASQLIVAEIFVNLVALASGVVLALVAGFAFLSIPVPEQPLVVIAAFLIGAVQMMGFGALIAAWTRSSGAATGVGMIAYFPMLFFAGIWLPGPVMSDTLQTVSTFVPLGAAAQALTVGWFETGFPDIAVRGDDRVDRGLVDARHAVFPLDLTCCAERLSLRATKGSGLSLRLSISGA